MKRMISPATPSSAHGRRVYRREYVERLFDSIAPKYDVLNHLLSFGRDILWRKRVVWALRAIAPQRLLDVATGTGDLAIAAATLRPRSIVGIDVSAGMLNLATDKIRRQGLDKTISVQRADAEHLPFPDASFDAVTVAFGVRNFADLNGGLREMARVLRRGGVAAILEFSKPAGSFIRALFAAYSRSVIPSLGGAISGNPEAYKYLPATVAEFPSGDAFARILQDAGFETVSVHEQTFGIATLYLASR